MIPNPKHFTKVISTQTNLFLIIDEKDMFCTQKHASSDLLRQKRVFIILI